METTAHTWLAFHTDLSFHLLGKHLGYGKSQPHTCLEHIVLPENIEDLTQSAFLDSAPRIIDRQTEKYKQINRERSETVTKIIQMKEDKLEVRYPGKEENELIQSIERGETDLAERALSRYLEGIMVFDAGNIQMVKVRLLSLFSRLFSPESDIQEDYNSLRIIENIGNAEEFKSLFEHSREFVRSACEIMSSDLYDGRSQVVTQAIRIINRSYYEDLNLSSVSGEIHVNPSYLSSLFHKEMGKSFVNYLTEVRLKRAVSMLENTSDSIQEIAFACGFKEPNYFSRIFRKKYGRSPREYRSDKA